MATTPPPYTGVTGIYTVIDKHQAVSKADFDGTARPGQIVIDTTDYSLHVADDTGALNAVGSGGGGGSTSPAGADTEIQFNDAGSFGASSALTFDGLELRVDADELVTGNVVVEGILTAQVFHEKSITMTTNNIDLTKANYFTKTITGPTTLTVSGIPAPGNAIMICLTLVNAGTNVTWFSGIKWSGGSPPVFTVTGTDILGFFTVDGGTTWRGLILAMDSK